MPDKRWFFELNHGVSYYVNFVEGELVLTSRVRKYELDEHLIQVALVPIYSEMKLKDFSFLVGYPYKDGTTWSRKYDSVSLGIPENEDHTLRGKRTINIGPVSVDLEYSCNAGSFFGDYSFVQDTPICL